MDLVAGEARASGAVSPRLKLTGVRNSEITFQLHGWARQDGRCVVCGSSTGFMTPSGLRSPDAAWVAKSQIAELDPVGFAKFWRLCPGFVIELKPESRRLPQLQKKMQEWIANGAALAWLLDPETRTVEIYRREQEQAEVLINPATVSGEGPVAGFVLDLAPVWDPIF